MNFIEKIVYCYEYLFYEEYVCYNCGLNFRMKFEKDHGDDDFIPACSRSCLFGGLCSTYKTDQIKSFKAKYGDQWRVNYIEFLKNN